jgi:hypothetical protein
MSEQVRPLFHLAKHKDGKHPGSSKLRWFVKYGDLMTDYGFSTKSEAAKWIEMHWLYHGRVEWQVGYMFALKGDATEISIVNKNGHRPKGIPRG